MLFTSSVQCSFGSLARAARKGKCLPQRAEEEVRSSLFAGDTVEYVESPQDCEQTLTSVSGNESNLQSSVFHASSELSGLTKKAVPFAVATKTSRGEVYLGDENASAVRTAKC